MSSFAVRCCLVGTAVVLLVVGVSADLPGQARSALLVAGGWCAVLDLVVARTDRRPRSLEPAVVLVPPLLDGCPDDALHLDGRPDDAGPATSGILLGRRPDGAPVRTGADPQARCHLVVVGTGALAEGTYAALQAQLTALAGTGARTADRARDPAPDRAPTDTGAVRALAGPGLGPAVRSTRGTLPPGTAVTVRFDHGGSVRATVVLVPGLHLLPRRWDHLVEVTRHGCRTQDHPDGQPAPIEPVLPLLVG